MTLARISPDTDPPCFTDISGVDLEQLRAWAQERIIPLPAYHAEIERRRQEQQRERTAK